MAAFPRRIGNRPLGDDAKIILPGQRESELNYSLIGDIDRRLESVECATFDGIVRGITVTAVTDITSVSEISRLLQCADCFALPQLVLGTAVQMDYINMLGPKPLQAALNAFENGSARPIWGTLGTARMAAFGEQKEFVPPVSNRLSDQFLANVITLS